MHGRYWIRFGELHVKEKGNYACKEPFSANLPNSFPEAISTDWQVPLTFYKEIPLFPVL